MSVFKKINKETGDEELRYIVYNGNSNNLFYEVYNMGHFAEDTDLSELSYYVCVKQFNDTTYIIIHDDDHDVEFCTHVPTGHIVVPYYFWWIAHDEEIVDHEIDFSKARTYTPEQLEELYPSEKYDTIEVLK